MQPSGTQRKACLQGVEFIAHLCHLIAEMSDLILGGLCYRRLLGALLSTFALLLLHEVTVRLVLLLR